MNFETDIKNCLAVLNQGGLILYPTDTIWGIGCDATNKIAVDKIYALKKRNDEKSLIILLADEKDIFQYIANPHPQVFDYLKTTNKPTTVIYEDAINLAENLINKDGSVAIRVVKDHFCKHLIKRFRKPIVSTSANISGHSTPVFFDDIESVIKNGVDYIVQHRQNDLTINLPSSIIKFNKDGSVIIIRS